MPPSHFAEDFFELCRYCLVSADRSVYKERTIDFIARAVVHISTHAAERDDGTARNILLIKTFLFCAKVSPLWSIFFLVQLGPVVVLTLSLF